MNDKSQIEKLWWSPAELTAAGYPSHSVLYQHMKSGRLIATKFGRSTKVSEGNRKAYDATFPRADFGSREERE